MVITPALSSPGYSQSVPSEALLWVVYSGPYGWGTL